GIVLTPAGEAMFEAARGVEQAMLAVERASLRLDERPRGTVKVASTDALSQQFVTPALAKLRAKHPDIDVVLLTGPQTVDVARLEADVALRMARPTAADLIARKAGTIPYGLFASRAYLASKTSKPTRLEGHDLLLMTADVIASHRDEVMGLPIGGARV